jgi:hypothetical protein
MAYVRPENSFVEEAMVSYLPNNAFAGAVRLQVLYCMNR